MSVYYLPIDTEVPAQRFSVTLDGHKVAMFLRWQVTQAEWYYDIDCEAVGLHSHGFSLRTGIDIIANRSLGELGMLMLVDLQGNDDPDFEGLGIRWRLVYVTRDESGTL